SDLHPTSLAPGAAHLIGPPWTSLGAEVEAGAVRTEGRTRDLRSDDTGQLQDRKRGAVRTQRDNAHLRAILGNEDVEAVAHQVVDVVDDGRLRRPGIVMDPQRLPGRVVRPDASIPLGREEHLVALEPDAFPT